MSEQQKHRHEFSVDAACDGCGMMISEVLISEKERADGNFGSYLRVRDLHTEAREKVAELERHQAEAAKAIRALKHYAAHRLGCSGWIVDFPGGGAEGVQRPCNCGLDAALDENSGAIQRAREGT